MTMDKDENIAANIEQEANNDSDNESDEDKEGKDTSKEQTEAEEDDATQEEEEQDGMKVAQCYFRAPPYFRVPVYCMEETGSPITAYTCRNLSLVTDGRHPIGWKSHPHFLIDHLAQTMSGKSWQSTQTSIGMDGDSNVLRPGRRRFPNCEEISTPV
jgi:hypothetical protein